MPALLFDLDGTMLNSDPIHLQVYKEMWAARGMELAPIMGLADLIVDIVDTGNTLKANGLEPCELIAPISSRLVASRASMKVKYDQIQPIIDQMAAAVERQRNA